MIVIVMYVLLTHPTVNFNLPQHISFPWPKP